MGLLFLRADSTVALVAGDLVMTLLPFRSISRAASLFACTIPRPKACRVDPVTAFHLACKNWDILLSCLAAACCAWVHLLPIGTYLRLRGDFPARGETDSDSAERGICGCSQSVCRAHDHSISSWHVYCSMKYGLILSDALDRRAPWYPLRQGA